MNHILPLISALVFVQLVFLSEQLLAQPAAKPKPLAFVASGTNGFTFDTGVLQGTLRAKGESAGLSSVIHKPTGLRLDRSKGLFSHYRVFTANKRYGAGAWDWPSTARLLSDGAVETHWASAAGRPFEMWAVYRWTAPGTLDVETRVRAEADLVKFESFLACYFTEIFSNSLVYVREPGLGAGTPGFLAAEQTAGVWQMFPRDATVVPIIQDGRWKLEPHPVDWVIRPQFAMPLGLRRAPASSLAAVLMAPAGDCFAICTPQQTEGHYSMYLSLFGRDMKKGETARARARLLIMPSLTDDQAVEAYGAFVRETSGR
jgi:hypothetical protein